MNWLNDTKSIIAVVSLTIHHIDRARKPYEFWHSIENAPASVRMIVADLKILLPNLSDISVFDQHYKPNATTTSISENLSVLRYQQSK
jgi:hypothetical protein